MQTKTNETKRKKNKRNKDIIKWKTKKSWTKNKEKTYRRRNKEQGLKNSEQ